jgi:hypothetical protein
MATEFRPTTYSRLLTAPQEVLITMAVSTAAPISTTDALTRLDDILDLSNVRMKLADPEDGKGHSDAELDLREGEYRKFLALHMAFPDAEIAPCKLVDEFWHQHILDTEAYRDDCEAIFGGYLHHFPYFGMRGDEDAQALRNIYADTLARYRMAFGAPPEETWLPTEATKCRRTNCKVQRCK